jgi:mannose-6-phosphate isomerase-like protein (cupin superfamily)
MSTVKAFVSHLSAAPLDGWDDPLRGSLSWRTLLSGGMTPTDSLTAGVAEFGPGGALNLHRHAAAEIYFVLEGEGIVSIDGHDHAVAPGSIAFIPASAPHGVRNSGGGTLKLFYAFAKGSFGEVEYEF